MALPSGYTQLEYIESTGSQYVDTGFVPNGDSKIALDMAMLADLTTKNLTGVRNSSSDATNRFGIVVYTATDLFGAFFGPFAANLNATDTKRHLFVLGADECSVDGVSYGTPGAQSFLCSYSLPLLSWSNGSGGQVPISGRLYGCKLYSGGAMVRDYIPVQRLDGTVGLLDQVNNVFYPDAAGGNFIAGPLAAKPEAPASLELIGTTRNAVVLAWSGDPVGQSYRLYRDGVVVYEGSALCYTDAGLASGSAHVYSVHTLSGSTESEGVTTEATTTEGIVLITDRTAADVSAGRRKGFYNAMDLIRVGEAMVYAQGLLKDSGYAVSIAVKLDWQLNDIPTKLQIDQYISSVRNLRHAMDLLATTPAAPDSMDRLGYSGANDIEKILEDVEYTVHHVFSCLWRAGQFDAWAGDRRPFATANSDMGRTWEELDDTNTTWANWEVATWYLLLYGNLKEEGVVS